LMALRGFMGQATAGLRTVKFYQGQGVRFFEVPKRGKLSEF
jgi:hypothetical protein